MHNTHNTMLSQSSDYSMEAIRSRIQHKLKDYTTYNFTARQSCALNIFFDLSQEFDSLESQYNLAVAMLQQLFFLKAEFYLINDDHELQLKTPAVIDGKPELPHLYHEIHFDGHRYCIPVWGKDALFLPKDQRILMNNALQGFLVLYPERPLHAHELLFYEKFANRVGFSLHNKQLAERNKQHILFVRKLAHDIGHNIITPNMQHKLLLSSLSKHVATFGELMQDKTASANDLQKAQKTLEQLTKNIVDHFTYSALFLETLLRQSHFDEGHYVLRCTEFDIKRLIILPQLEHYQPRFAERKMAIAYSEDKEITSYNVYADHGLITQVFTNLITNALKYSQPPQKGRRACMECNIARAVDFFGKDLNGIRVSVSTTGMPILPEERPHLFTESYRTSNSKGIAGTGHGLFFIKEIISEHGGSVGYEALAHGNNFFFVLPEVSSSNTTIQASSI